MCAICAEPEAVPRPAVTSWELPSPKLNEAFVNVPLESLPAAVKVTERGAEPDEVDVLRLRHTGEALAASVGVAVGTVVGEEETAVVGDGETVVEGEGDGDGVPDTAVLPSQVFASIAILRGEEPPALKTFASFSSSLSVQAKIFVVAVSIESGVLVPASVGAFGTIFTVPTSVVVVIAFVISCPVLSTILMPVGVSVGPSRT